MVLNRPGRRSTSALDGPLTPEEDRSGRSERVSAMVAQQDAAAPTSDLTRAREVRQQNAEVQRELLATRLGVPKDEIKPCLALMGGRPQGERTHIASVIAYELAKLGASQEDALSYLGWYVGRCDQPPLADHRFTDGEARAAVRSVYRQKESGRRIYGFGCVRRSSPLLEFCPYGAERDPENRFTCPYISRRMVKPNRRRIASLVGAMNLLHLHLRRGLPKGWRKLAAARRALLCLTLAKLEVERGHPGGELWTSERQLEAEFPLPIKRDTIRRDLAAMQAAGWIEWRRGQCHKQTASEGRPPRGMCVMRLLPGDALVTAVKAVFPGAAEEEEW